jgi:hypothetical protein
MHARMHLLYPAMARAIKFCPQASCIGRILGWPSKEGNCWRAEAQREFSHGICSNEKASNTAAMHGSGHGMPPCPTGAIQRRRFIFFVAHAHG